VSPFLCHLDLQTPWATPDPRIACQEAGEGAAGKDGAALGARGRASAASHLPEFSGAPYSIWQIFRRRILLLL
jgi:hypothetical protein